MSNFHRIRSLISNDIENSNATTVNDTISYLKNILHTREQKLIQALEKKSYTDLCKLNSLHYEHLTAFPNAFKPDIYSAKDAQFIAQIFEKIPFTKEDNTSHTLLLTAKQGLFSNALQSIDNFKHIETYFPEKLPHYIQKHYDDNKLGYHTTIEVFDFLNDKFSFPLDKKTISFAFESKNNHLADALLQRPDYMNLLDQEELAELLLQSISASNFSATIILANKIHDERPFKYCFTGQTQINTLYPLMHDSCFFYLIAHHEFTKEEAKFLVKPMAKNFHQEDCFRLINHFFNLDNQDCLNAFIGQAVKMQLHPEFKNYCIKLIQTLRLQDNIERKIASDDTHQSGNNNLVTKI
jgi:hypothetical protein